MISPTRVTAVIAACCVLGFVASTTNATAPVDLFTGNWSTSSAGNLAENPPTKEAVESFIERLAPNLCSDDGPFEPSLFYSFRFADLRKSGNLSLLVGRDCASREFASVLYIVDKTPSGFEVHRTPLMSPSNPHAVAAGIGGDVGSHVEDLAGDGNLELVIPTDITWYGGAIQCTATWPVVYAWTGAGYTNVSSRFKDFYQRRLDYLNDQIAALPPPSGTSATLLLSGQPGFEDDCIKAEAAKIQRVLGISPNAGLDQAIILAGSANPDSRVFALQLLANIGTPEAIAQIQKLTADPNKTIASRAQGWLANAPRFDLSDQSGTAGFMPIPLSSVPSAPK